MNEKLSDNVAIKITGLGKHYALGRRRRLSAGTLARLGSLKEMVGLGKKNRQEGESLWAIRDLDLQVNQGEILGIIGHNGAGKSTLLKLLSRIVRPSEGSILIRGHVASMLEMGLGFDRDLTVKENILMHSMMTNISSLEAIRQLESIVKAARLEGLLDTPLRLCPSGSYIRLAFATVISLDCSIILADEILAVGDPSFQAECLDRIREGCHSGKTVLFVSHDMAAIKRLCHRVIWLDRGRLVAEGHPIPIIDAYTESTVGAHDIQSSPIEQLHQKDGLQRGSDAAIRSMRLVSSDGSEIGAMAMNNEAELEVIISVSNVVEQFVLHIACYHDHQIVYTQSLPRTSTTHTPELYSIRLEVPRHFFNEHKYEFKAVLEVWEYGVSRLISSEDQLSVRFHNTDPEDSAWGNWPWGRPGFICPKLDWDWSITTQTTSEDSSDAS